MTALMQYTAKLEKFPKVVDGGGWRGIPRVSLLRCFFLGAKFDAIDELHSRDHAGQ